jgi:Predicted RNA-binding protein
MDKIRVSAKTMEEAITKASIQLQTTSDRISYTVLVQGSKGILGIGAKPWILEAFVKEGIEEEPEEKKTAPLPKGEEKKESTEKVGNKTVEKQSNPDFSAKKEDRKKESFSREKKQFARNTAENYKGFSRGGYDPIPPVREELTEQNSFKKTKEDTKQRFSAEKIEFKALSEDEILEVKDKAKQFLDAIFSGMEMQVEMQMDFHEEANELYVNIEGPDMGILIGKRGQTLDSLQYLCSLVINKDHKEDYLRVKLDTEDYRKRREQTLRSLAKNIAYKVKKSRKSVNLEPMNPYERRIIHSALQNDAQVATKSEGDDPFRHVVIYYKNNGKFRQDRKFKNRYNNNMKDNRGEKQQ